MAAQPNDRAFTHALLVLKHANKLTVSSDLTELKRSQDPDDWTPKKGIFSAIRYVGIINDYRVYKALKEGCFIYESRSPIKAFIGSSCLDRVQYRLRRAIR